jgi:hypothetical protein
MSAAAAAVGVFDWGVDVLRGLFGLAPHPPELLNFAVDQLIVQRAAYVTLEARRTRQATLQILQVNNILFTGPAPRDGKARFVPLTQDPVELEAVLEPRHPANAIVRFETVLVPEPNGPAIDRFDVPAIITLGDGITCLWDAPRAESVQFAVIQDGAITGHTVSPVGQMVLPAPALPGTVTLRLTAECGWGQTTLVRTVAVAAPELKLVLLQPAAQCGYPGDRVRFEWKAEAAESLWLFAPGANPKRLDRDGGILDVTIGLQPMEFQVVARRYGGVERSAVLRAIPDPLACLENSHE